MKEQKQHEMILKSTQSSGVEEWVCPECGRRVLMSWPPNYKKIVMEVGDETALHCGGKGGVSMQVSDISSKEELDIENDPRLSIWSAWMESTNFNGLWNLGD